MTQGLLVLRHESCEDTSDTADDTGPVTQMPKFFSITAQMQGIIVASVSATQISHAKL
jgi:hypothetical protein